jgi:hypothetical protein
METGNPSKRVVSAIAMAGFAALCAGWSASAVSATTTEVECDGISADLRTLETPLEAFTVRPVDHVSIDTDPTSNIASLDIAAASSESSAPFLYLTPRVASVLRNIFEATREFGDEDRRQDVSSSPIAESDSISDVMKLIDESSPAVPVETMNLPLFQQQMFRTDI